jgi:glycosyltransferase involved in cell wall biosynthesis
MRQVRDSELLGDRRIEVIPTGVNLHSFAPQDKKAARRALSLPVEDRVILFGAFAGRANPRKGWKELRDALWRLHLEPELETSVHVITFGEDALDRERLPVLGTERQLATAYSAADLFVAPSLQENLANTVLEALACGTPVVAFDVGGMSEAVTDELNGYLASERDSGSLTRTLLKALSVSFEVREHQREAARATAERKFDLRLQARRYATLYQELSDGVVERVTGRS